MVGCGGGGEGGTGTGSGSGSGSTSVSISAKASVSLAYNTRTNVSVFAYEETPSWDASSTIDVTNTSSISISIAALLNQFQIGGCNQTNARGIARTLLGVGAVDQAYLDAAYPYTLPTGQFSSLAPGATKSIQITLQGCPVNLFNATNTSTNASSDIFILNGENRSRSSASVVSASITFLSKPPITPASLPVASISATGTVSLAYNSRTNIGVFTSEITPSWDATSTINIVNNSTVAISMAALVDQFQIGGCTQANARGIVREIRGLGAIDQAYLNAGYPYTLPVAQFSSLAPGGTRSVQITLQGCPLNLFNSTTTTTNASLDIAVLIGETRSRSAAFVAAANITFLSTPPTSAGGGALSPPPLSNIYNPNLVTTAACVAVPAASSELQYLNQFWSRTSTLCENSTIAVARAVRSSDRVEANSSSLNNVAQRFGPTAATGVLAHEWGHLVQGLTPPGVASELQADCLAGVHLKWAGVPTSGLMQFKSLSLASGNAPGAADDHGTGSQRTAAVQSGYDAFDRSKTYIVSEMVAQLCPYGRVY